MLRSSIIAILASAPSIWAQETTQTWSVAFYGGSDCHGLGVGDYNGPDTPQLSQPCTAIPDVGYTQSADYRVATGDYSYVFMVHRTDDCSDQISSYTGFADQPTCIPLDGSETHFSILTVKAISKTRDLATIPEQTGLEKREGLEKRQRSLSFALLAVSVTAFFQAQSWIDKTVTRCSKINADNSNIEQANCGLGVTFSVINSFLTVSTAYGSYHYYRNVQQRDMAHIDDGFSRPANSIGELFSRFAHNKHVEYNPNTGEFTTVEALGSKRSDDGNWAMYGLNHTNPMTGHSYYTTLHHNVDTDQHRISAPDASASSGDLDKRATRYTAWYSWQDGVQGRRLQYSENDVQNIAISIYRFGKNNNKDSFCASVTGQNMGSKRRERIDSGYYALIPYSFTDQSDQC